MEQKQSPNALLLLTIFNHASWSTLHIAARYLQVYAKPITFDGLGVLSSAKGSAAVFLFLIGTINSCIDASRSDGEDEADENYDPVSSQSSLPSSPSADIALS